jgi:DHA1 family multidrug resistance protein-like MFS transporter
VNKQKTGVFSFISPPGLITLLSNFALQTSAVFLPLYAEDIGASKFQIGIISGAYGIAYAIAALLLSRYADRGKAVIMVRFSLFLGAIAFFSQTLAGEPVSLTVARAVLGASFGISSAALMAYNFAGGRSTGRFASLGALGWLLGSILAIFVQSTHILFVLSTAACGIAFFMAFRLTKQEVKPLVKTNTIQIVRSNIRVYLSFVLRQFGANMVWAIFPLYLAALGASKGNIAFISGINTFVQIIAMMYVEKFKASRLFLIGLIISTLAFLGYSQAAAYWLAIPLQMLMAVAWSFIYVGALLLLLRENEAQAASVGILFSSINLSASLGSLLGGYIAQEMGYKILMYFASGICFLGVAITAIKKTSPFRRDE